jgi:hypothetical protein
MAARLLAIVSQPNAAECNKGCFFDRASEKLSQLARFDSNKLVSVDLHAGRQHYPHIADEVTPNRTTRRAFGTRQSVPQICRYQRDQSIGDRDEFLLPQSPECAG